MERELARNFDMTNTSITDQAKQEFFQASKDPSENARQIAMIGEDIEKLVHNAYETARLPLDAAMATDEGKELSAAVGPKVMLSQRDKFFIEKFADRYLVNFGQELHYTTTRDGKFDVSYASMTDGGPGMSVNHLQTMKDLDVPVPVMGSRFLTQFEYDDPQLAESNWSSRAKAVDQARYKTRKALQDLMIAAWKGAFTTSFSAAVKHDLAGGHTHPTGNVIDWKTTNSKSGKLDLDCVSAFDDYFAPFGMSGQKILFVSHKRFNEIKGWVSTSTHTDAGLIFAQQIFKSGGSVDAIPVYDVLVVKQNTIPDNEGHGLMIDDGDGNGTLGVYQWGKITTMPTRNPKPLRAGFDLYIAGVCGVCFDSVRAAKVLFA